MPYVAGAGGVSTSDAARVELTSISAVAASGEQSVQPKQTATYELMASGPGGAASSSATVNVNSGIQANLAPSTAEVLYRRAEDNVVEQGGSALSRSTSNAQTVSIDPLGSADPRGNRPLQVTSQKKDLGAVDEIVSYSGCCECLWSDRDANSYPLHRGLIEPGVNTEKELAMRSVCFAAAQPGVEHPEGGLLESQQATLSTLAANFKTYLAIKPDAHLTLTDHADVRESAEYNQALTERRVNRVKQFLLEQCVSEANLDARAVGQEQELSADQVKDLVNQDTELTDAQRKMLLRQLKVVLLAQNRRVDIMLSTTGQQSVKLYPFNAVDAMTLLDEKAPTPSKKASEKKAK